MGAEKISAPFTYFLLMPTVCLLCPPSDISTRRQIRVIIRMGSYRCGNNMEIRLANPDDGFRRCPRRRLLPYPRLYTPLQWSTSTARMTMAPSLDQLLDGCV